MTDAHADDELFASIQKCIGGLQAQLISEMPPYVSQPGAKLLRLTVVWREALLHRVVDLASAALSMFQQGRLVPGCTLTRSLHETVAQLHYFHKKLAVAVESEELSEITDHLRKGAFGSKDDSTKHDAIQILTAIKHLDNEFTGSQAEYFHLCEYAHPNLKGGLAAYTRIDIPAYDVVFGINPQQLPMGAFGLGALHVALLIAQEIRERHLKIEALFLDVVERHAENFFTD